MSDSVLFRGAAVITLDEEGQILPSADIAVRDGEIVALGEIPEEFEPQETIDVSHHLALPGFFNAHTHAAMTLVRGWADDLPLDRWFNERIWVAESNLEEEDVYWGAALAAAEMIRGGTVAFADHYFYMDHVARVVEESGLKANLAWCVFGLDPAAEVGGGLEAGLDFARRWQGAANGRIRTVLGPHSPYLCPPEFLQEVATVARDEGLGLHLHLSESEIQITNSLGRYGLSPTAHLADLGVLDQPTIAAHCIHLAPGDIDILAQHQTSVVQCPNCHFKLAMGVADVPAMLEQGIGVALGTDGVASNNNLDMLQEAQLAVLMQKNHRRDPEILPGDMALRLATQGGARAMGFEQSGVIAPGYAADLIFFDLDKPHLRPRHNLVSNILYSAQSADISHVVVQGKLLLQDGDLLTLDEKRILDEAERRAWRMVGQDMKILRRYRG